MTKQPQKDIKFDENKSSSAATTYGGVDITWLKKIQGSFTWFKMPQVNLGKIVEDIKTSVARGLRGGIVKEVGTAIIGGLKNIFGKIKQDVSQRIGSIISVGNKIVGKLTNTPEGQGLALFGAITSAIIGGGILLGAGPEVVTGMLRISQLVYTLNLNESDEQIDKQIEGDITNLYAQAGDVMGTGLASFVSGGVFRIPRVQINMTKIAILFRALNEEAREQLLSQVRSLARNAFFGGARMLIKVFYRDTRKWLKGLAKANPNHPLIKLIPGGAKSLEHWGEKGAPPFSLQLIFQKGVEKLQANPLTKDIGTFIENFAESFGEGIQEFLPNLVRQPVS